MYFVDVRVVPGSATTRINSGSDALNFPSSLLHLSPNRISPTHDSTSALIVSFPLSTCRDAIACESPDPPAGSLSTWLSPTTRNGLLVARAMEFRIRDIQYDAGCRTILEASGCLPVSRG